MFEKIPSAVFIDRGFRIDWTRSGIGFGQFHFYEKDGKIYCDNEMMSKEFIKIILNSLVDQCTLTDPPDKKKE